MEHVPKMKFSLPKLKKYTPNTGVIILGVVLIACVLSGCAVLEKPRDFDVTNFDPLLKVEDPVFVLTYNINSSVTDGIVLPLSEKNEFFHFNFEVKNNTKQARQYFYKIFYQNKTYKHAVAAKSPVNGTLEYNVSSDQNFYGSWKQVEVGFRSTAVVHQRGEVLAVRDSFQIVGNPRNEEQCFFNRVIPPTEEQLQSQMEEIKADLVWYNKEKAKARSNGVAVEVELRKSAEYIYETSKKQMEKLNYRRRRSPRMGEYEFMLVVLDEQALLELPGYVKRIDQKKDSRFMNPFYYFNYGDGSRLRGCQVINSKEVLTLKTNVDFSFPIKNGALFSQDTIACSDVCSINGDDKAIVARIPHDLNFNKELVNVDSIVSWDSFNTSFFNGPDKLEIKNIPETTVGKNDCLCEWVANDFENHRITLKNPAGTKKSVGLGLILGLSYGKYTIGLSLPDYINDQDMWNGLSTAVWLENQSVEDWNNRSKCADEGYVSMDGSVGAGLNRKSRVATSRIEMELMCVNEVWPKMSYKDYTGKVPESDSLVKMTTVCSNWDMACPEPKNFQPGAMAYKYEETRFDLHRWNDYFQALECRRPVDKGWIDNKDVVIQLEWCPDHIVYRMGPDLEHLQVISAMKTDVTKIPDNQMVLKIAQRFNETQWWPGAFFRQEEIPFFDKAFDGYIKSITIE